MLYVRIDVAKYKHDLALIDSDGKIFVRHLQIANNREGFTQLQMTLEDTGHYSFNIIRFLRSFGYPTFSYIPFLIKEFAKSQSLGKTKTDKKDAVTIARKLRDDVDKTLFEFDVIMFELKYATRNSNHLKQGCAKQKIHYVRLLDILFPELSPFLGGKSAHHNRFVYDLLKTFPSPKKLLRLILQS